MPPEGLKNEGNGTQKKELLKVNSLAGYITEMETPDHFSKDNDGGYQDGRPLEPIEKRLKQRDPLINVIFKLHVYSGKNQRPPVELAV